MKKPQTKQTTGHAKNTKNDKANSKNRKASNARGASGKKPNKETKALSTSDGRGDLVVVGASAGGVAALSVLVKNLREDFPAPVVIAQHLDPKRPSNLNAILERRASLPIVTPQDGEKTPLEVGKVYVVPSNRHVMIKDGNVELETDRGTRPRPSVDLLLSTAAKFYGERLVAVILSGAGRDGAAGAIEVKQAGGTVIVQNPETAQYPSMPMSLLPTVVDHVADVELIGPLLHEIIERGHHEVPKEKIEDPVHRILDRVKQRANIDFEDYKPTTIMRRIMRRAVITRSPNVEDYEQYIELNADEIDELVKAFLIKVTGFFRDPEAFEFIREEVVPDLIRRGRENGRVIRCWSAGCSTGEEAYSLALLIADALGKELPEWSVKVFATDLDGQAVTFARHGIYPDAVLKELPEKFREKYFEHSDSGYRIVKPIRQLVIFGNQDLNRAVPFPRMDLVLCRNVLIYLKPELQEKIVDLFAYSLHLTRGYLILGRAETARPSKASFEIVNKKWKVYRCTKAPTLAAEALAHAEVAEKTVPVKKTAPAPEMKQVVESRPDEMGEVRRINETMLRLLPTGMVIIDRGYRVLSMNSTARRFLGVRELAEAQDFLHVARVLPYNQIRAAIDNTFRERSVSMLKEVELEAALAGDGRFLDVTVMLLQTDQGSNEHAAISLVDCTETVQTRRRLEAVEFEQAQLVNDLSGTNKRLADINKELQDANEELQAANEELMQTQEELQSTNEEFEATNEELQATNEELETSNEELQATNEELQTTNDELTARTHELQDATTSLADERLKLSEITDQAPLHILVLRGPQLIIESYNDAYAKLFGDRDVKGHAFEEVFHDQDLRELVEKIHEARREDIMISTDPIRIDYDEKAGKTVHAEFTYRIVPIHATNRKVERVALYAESVKSP